MRVVIVEKWFIAYCSLCIFCGRASGFRTVSGSGYAPWLSSYL